MRKVTMTGDEASLVFNALEAGDPQRGLGLADIRNLMPILDKLEKGAKKIPVPGGERIEFAPTVEVALKESEFNLVISKLDSSTGWISVTVGRKVVALVDRIKETVSTPDSEEKKA